MNDGADAFRRLGCAAWLSAAVHLVAGLAMLLVLWRGLESSDFAASLIFLVEYELAWQAAWFTWNLAALVMLYFVVCFARAHRGTSAQRTVLHYAVVVCAAAVPLDLAAETIEMAVLPMLARDALGQTTVEPMNLFLAFQRAATVMTGFFANGLYTLSSVLLVWSTRRDYPRWVVVAGALVGISGFGLSGAALAGSVPAMVAANILLMPALLAWQAGVAVTAGRRSTVAAGL
jgi:hypothetical protein